jgi:dCMP deaminase
MNLACDIAKRSKDTKLKVGCVIADENLERILGFGWNGGARGQSDERESIDPGQSNLIHAEVNALIKTDYSIPNKVVFLTHAPCKVCAKVLVNAKIERLYYKIEYNGPHGLDILQKAGIIIEKI